MTQPALVASLIILGLEDLTPVSESESAFHKDARWICVHRAWLCNPNPAIVILLMAHFFLHPMQEDKN